VLGAQLDPKLGDTPAEYPFLPAVHDLAAFRPDPQVTFLVGENGSGKSTLIEAIAIACGFSSEGGPIGSELGRVPRPSVKELGDMLLIDGGPHKPSAGFFLRAESFFNVAAVIDGRDLVEVYGGRPMHAQSHGESFLALAANRFGPDGLFIFDEPEAALSVTSQLAFIALIHRSAAMGSQFIVATHSPILLGYPGAAVYEASESGLERIDARDADAVRLTRDFMLAPERFLRHLFADEDADADPAE
jgi:predicted ATPase